MEQIELVQELKCDYEGEKYLIEVFARPDGSHFARTTFSPSDVIISDGVSLDEVLLRHQDLLPLAIRSRQMYFPSRTLN
jgi:hypothetical protein